MEKSISVSHLSKRYEVQALQDVSFDVNHGEIFGLTISANDDSNTVSAGW